MTPFTSKYFNNLKQAFFWPRQFETSLPLTLICRWIYQMFLVSLFWPRNLISYPFLRFNLHCQSAVVPWLVPYSLIVYSWNSLAVVLNSKQLSTPLHVCVYLPWFWAKFSFMFHGCHWLCSFGFFWILYSLQHAAWCFTFKADLDSSQLQEFTNLPGC